MSGSNKTQINADCTTTLFGGFKFTEKENSENLEQFGEQLKRTISLHNIWREQWEIGDIEWQHDRVHPMRLKGM